MNIIEKLEAEHAAKLPGAKMPAFQPGDTVVVNVKVAEGERTRIQAYEGVCIARSGGGLNENFTVRKISYGEGVERVFPVYSPMIDSVKVMRRGKVRRAKLYYLRDRRGKSARIAERTDNTASKDAGKQPPPRTPARPELSPAWRAQIWRGRSCRSRHRPEGAVREGPRSRARPITGAPAAGRPTSRSATARTRRSAWRRRPSPPRRPRPPGSAAASTSKNAPYCDGTHKSL